MNQRKTSIALAVGLSLLSSNTFANTENTKKTEVLKEQRGDHLGRIAPMHATERDSCSEDFASFLSSYTNCSHRYRRCNNLPSELLRELTVPPMLDVIDAPTKLQFENVLLWMHGGTSDQMSRLHFDMNGVLLTQLDGRKNFLATTQGRPRCGMCTLPH